MKYTVIAPSVQLTAGVLALTDAQAKARMHNLKPVKGGYEIVNAVQFKRGEEFGYEGDITLDLVDALEEKGGKSGKKKDAPPVPPVQTSAQNDSGSTDGTGTPPTE